MFSVKLFLIESKFANNFATAVINIKVPKQHSVLWVLYWPQTFIWEDSIYILGRTDCENCPSSA